MAKKEKVTFDAFYQEQFADRWEPLKKALLGASTHHELKEGLQKSYFLDPASVRAASALSISENDSILDLCAAPGGKSLVLALKMKTGCRLTSNEMSSARRMRLKRVLDEHLPSEIRERVTVTSYDATKWCLHEHNAYSKIILDAPCSSEAHVLNSPKHLEEWSASRIKRLAMQQFAMLASALDVLIPGGELLYSTCALADEENDGVIEKLHKKRAGQFEVLPVFEDIGEATIYGWKMWPDITPGVGPIYYARIRKVTV